VGDGGEGAGTGASAGAVAGGSADSRDGEGDIVVGESSVSPRAGAPPRAQGDDEDGGALQHLHPASPHEFSVTLDEDDPEIAELESYLDSLADSDGDDD